ncbi:MAG TPA: DNA/RNA non-specific endonuclease [Chitinophagaceae bacterium]|nr:DNA/RNA non-specific endonuclease [Chitinophagaceae bacterium]
MNQEVSTINISIPTDELNNVSSIDITLSVKKIDSQSKVMVENTTEGTNAVLEIAKVDREQELVYDLCEGYDPDFLGINIPFPQPAGSLKKEIALQEDKMAELKYFHYSVIFNSVKRMPAISAVNVVGNAKWRKDNSKRSDNWLRDKRIEIDYQLADKFYKGSPFDKGHMSRFEDANWDKTEKEALRDGIYTCMYTNACPQVPGINRAGGVWGKLEKQVLEKGIKKESGDQAKMSVFNGPIFSDDKNKVYRGAIIPMDFFKIIMWLDDDNNLKATGFKLSQETLVDDSWFREKEKESVVEAIDIENVMAFKEYQCSIKQLSSLTKIDFSGIEQYDTFKGADIEEKLLLTEEDVVL